MVKNSKKSIDRLIERMVEAINRAYIKKNNKDDSEDKDAIRLSIRRAGVFLDAWFAEPVVPNSPAKCYNFTGVVPDDFVLLAEYIISGDPKYLPRDWEGNGN